MWEVTNNAIMRQKIYEIRIKHSNIKVGLVKHIIKQEPVAPVLFYQMYNINVYLLYYLPYYIICVLIAIFHQLVVYRLYHQSSLVILIGINANCVLLNKYGKKNFSI